MRTTRDWFDRGLTIARRARSFRWRALVAFAVAAVASVAIVMTRPRVYSSETIILYRETIRGSDLGTEIGHDPARKLGMRLKEMLFSRTSLQQIIDQFHLYPKIVAVRGYVDAVDEFRNHIVFRVRDGDTFGLSFEGNNPAVVHDVTQRLADALLEEHMSTRRQQATIVKDFLDAEAQRNGKDLHERENEMGRFLAEHPEFAGRAGTPTAGQPLVAIAAPKRAAAPRDRALQALERERARIEQRLAPPGAARATATVVPAGPPKQVTDAEAELKAAQRDLAEKAGRYTEQHPDVRAAKARVTAAEAKLQSAQAAAGPAAAPVAAPAPEKLADKERGELTAAMARIDGEIAAHRAELRKRQMAAAGLDGEEASGELTGAAGRIIGLEAEWSRIDREVKDARARQQQLEDKQFKATISASSITDERTGEMRILDPAYLPTHPAKPGRSVLLGASLAFALVVGLLVAFGSALLDDKLYEAWDLERLEIVPLLGIIPGTPTTKHAEQAGSPARQTGQARSMRRSVG